MCPAMRSLWGETYRLLLSMSLRLGEADFTYSTNNDLQSSSLLVNACSALQVPPRRKRSRASRASSSCMSSSSGRATKRPHACFRFTLDVRAFPDGRTPSGCLKTSLLSPALDGSSRGEGSILCRFTGLSCSRRRLTWRSLRVATGRVIIPESSH